MKTLQSLVLASSIILFISCAETSKKEAKVLNTETIVEKVDGASKMLEGEITSYNTIAVLDHHRMAEEEGAYTPPAIVTMFSDPQINTALVKQNQRIGLDLPFKILCYSEPDTASVSVAITSAEFIQSRHGISADKLAEYKTSLAKISEVFPEEMVLEANLDSVTEGFGTVMIQSDFDFETTVQNLKTAVTSQSDTRWFGEIDYQSEAMALGEEIRPTILLLFGAPTPGAKAMVTSPRIGLDAFCQKLLVYKNEAGEVWVAYNNIVAFAELYYGESTKPQQMINKRLKMTFTKVVSEPVE